jgi:hypothetical protein
LLAEILYAASSHGLLMLPQIDFFGELRLSHVAKSKIIEEIIIELRKKNLEIPASVMSNLKSARTLMKIERADPRSKGETEPKIDVYLSSVEAYVMTEASKQFGAEKVEKWMAALDLASCETCVTVVEEKEEMRFIPGVPRDQKWIRVEPIASLPLEKLEQMANESKLGFRREKDGHLIVYGSDEAVKGFVKKMTKPNV